MDNNAHRWNRNSRWNIDKWRFGMICKSNKKTLQQRLQFQVRQLAKTSYDAYVLLSFIHLLHGSRAIQAHQTQRV